MVIFFQVSFVSPLRSAHATDTFFTMIDHRCQHWLKKKLPLSPCVIQPCFPSPPGDGSRPIRPKSNPLVQSLDAWMADWVLSVASSCFESLVRCSASELCFFSPLDGAVRGITSMTSWFPMDEPLRSGNRPEPQHWNSDESTDVEEVSAEEDQDWNDDSDADWTIYSQGRSSLSGGSVCALVASDGQASLRRSISEIDLLNSKEEVNQTFACWKEDLVGITGFCGPVVDKFLLANVRDRGWETEL